MISIRIAGINISLFCNDPELKIQAEGATEKFVVDQTEHDVRIRADWGELFEEAGGEKLFDSGDLWKMYKKNGSYLFRFGLPALGSTPYKIAQVAKDFKEGEVLLHRPFFETHLPTYPLEYPLDELLLIHFLALGRGVEMHACGVMDSLGRGHLFVGQSGAGKTTMSRLWQNEPGMVILSDDRIVLRQMDKLLWMYGTPWHGEGGVASPAGVPLTRVYFLRHGEKNRRLPEMVSMMGTEVVARMLAASFVPFYSSEAMDFILEFFEGLEKAVPSYELRYVPDERVVEFIQGFED
jgi:hypothetical protein